LRVSARNRHGFRVKKSWVKNGYSTGRMPFPGGGPCSLGHLYCPCIFLSAIDRIGLRRPAKTGGQKNEWTERYELRKWNRTEPRMKHGLNTESGPRMARQYHGYKVRRLRPIFLPSSVVLPRHPWDRRHFPRFLTRGASNFMNARRCWIGFYPSNPRIKTASHNGTIYPWDRPAILAH